MRVQFDSGLMAWRLATIAKGVRSLLMTVCGIALLMAAAFMLEPGRTVATTSADEVRKTPHGPGGELSDNKFSRTEIEHPDRGQ